jgi:hypothetical protein
MINLAPKAKAGRPPKKKARKVSAPKAQAAAPRDDGFTAEDIAEINMFSEAIAKMNAAADERRRLAAKAKAKAKP